MDWVIIAFYNTLLKEREMEELTGKRGRKYRQLLGDVKEWRNCGNLKEEALARTQWRSLILEAMHLS
jgi:hypothetical protein